MALQGLAQLDPATGLYYITEEFSFVEDPCATEGQSELCSQTGPSAQEGCEDDPCEQEGRQDGSIGSVMVVERGTKIDKSVVVRSNGVKNCSSDNQIGIRF